ncbi:sensitivity to high expression protein she9 [Malassezia cuniculi]|uniref:Sensitive to high expression protein 9, mitochondrial n=1 Tax=Malassezia cuniculi TaxID=948313 RepID=A0AAF0ERS4_9BASI|nr:sensitivity to high expression protein she9 [Malassezia cuniculi]
MGSVLGVRTGIAVLRAPAAARLAGVRYVSSSPKDMFKPIKAYARERVEFYLPVVQSRLKQVSAQWNHFTGYTEIQRLKDLVTEKQNALRVLQEEKKHARQVYVGSVVERTDSQRKTNDLLTRRPSWNDADLAEYTRLLHSEHALAKAEEQNHEAFEQAESKVQKGVDDLMYAVMRRYHEEHIWSDRVRSVSTYASVGLAVLNVLIVEPYKRRRLANVIEERYLSTEEETLNALRSLGTKIDERLDAIQSGVHHKDAQDSSVADQLDRQIVLPAWVSRVQGWVSHVFARIAAVIPVDVQTISTTCGIIGGAIFTWIVTGVFN